MPYKLTRNIILSEKCLALAEHWHKCATQSNEPWRSEMMHATAKEFERAAARAFGQDQDSGRLS